MLAYVDLKTLLGYDMKTCSLRVVKHHYLPTTTTKMYGCTQTAYPRKNWSSLMLMNCEKLTLWTKEFVKIASGKQLHRFEGIPDSEIQDVHSGWNVLNSDKNPPDTRILHFTEGGPWFPEYANCPHAEDWIKMRDEMRNYNLVLEG